MYKYLEVLSISILLTNIYLLSSVFRKKENYKVGFELIILLSVFISEFIITNSQNRYTLIYHILYIGIYSCILIILTKKHIKYTYNNIDVNNEISKINLYKDDIDKTLYEKKVINNKLENIKFRKERIINSLLINLNNPTHLIEESNRRIYNNDLIYEKIANILPNAVFIKELKSQEIKYKNEAFIQLIENIDINFINDINIRFDTENEFLDFKRETIINRNGEKVTIEFGCILLEINKKRVLVGIINDITDNIKLELINDKIKENEIINKSKTEFFINMSHELKTPLNLIHASNQLMDSIYLKQIKESDNNLEILKDVKIIKKQVNILSTLIDNIIELSKLHHNSHQIDKDNYNIIEILEEIVEGFNIYTKKDNINIIFDPDEEEKIVNIDPDNIEKVITILLSLVARYSDNNSYINFKLKSKKDFIVINIENNNGYNHNKYLIDNERTVLDMGVKLAKEIIGLYYGHLNINKEDKSINISMQIKNICETKAYKVRPRNNNEEFIYSQYKKMCNF